jgi:hypothetical protein
MDYSSIKQKFQKRWKKIMLFYRNRKSRYVSKYNKLKKKVVDFLTSRDLVDTYKAILTILLDGLLLTIGLSYWIKFEITNVLVFGSLWFIMKKQAIGYITQILGSINLIRVGK